MANFLGGKTICRTANGMKSLVYYDNFEVLSLFSTERSEIYVGERWHIYSISNTKLTTNYSSNFGASLVMRERGEERRGRRVN
jgi:hypothetical protein